MTPVVSICVPVYNVAPYIGRCAHSLFSQTYPSIEYIFVDDHSTDPSLSILKQIIDAYPARKASVQILHNDRNHGLAYTRRKSIEAAQGEFVLCVDSDDYIAPQTVACMVKTATDTPCEMIIGGYVDEGAIGKKIVDISDITYKDLLQNAIEDRIFRLSGKLIRRELFTRPSVHFAPEGMDYLEDRIVLLYLLGECWKVAVVNEPFYHYMLHSSSVSGVKGEKHFRCLQQYWQLTDKYLAERGLTEKYLTITDRMKIYDKFHLIHFCQEIDICRRYKDLFAESERRYGLVKWSRGIAVTYFLTKRNLWLLLRLYKLIIADKR